jgi:hypothetical protein
MTPERAAHKVIMAGVRIRLVAIGERARLFRSRPFQLHRSGRLPDIRLQQPWEGRDWTFEMT